MAGLGSEDYRRTSQQAISEHPRRRPVHHRLQVVNREEIREYLQAVLDGREPCRGIFQIERHLGVGHRTLEDCFPLESSLKERLADSAKHFFHLQKQAKTIKRDRSLSWGEHDRCTQVGVCGGSPGFRIPPIALQPGWLNGAGGQINATRY
jgi:hypothetical protein